MALRVRWPSRNWQGDSGDPPPMDAPQWTWSSSRVDVSGGPPAPHFSREVQSTRCLLRLRLVVFVLRLLRTFSLARYSEGSSLVEFSSVFVCHEGVRRIEQQNPIVFGLVVVCYREEKIKKKEKFARFFLLLFPEKWRRHSGRQP